LLNVKLLVHHVTSRVQKVKWKAGWVPEPIGQFGGEINPLTGPES
jgi:hypothetical protein